MTALSSDDDRPNIALPKGTQLRNQYRLGPVLGAGGFGITYRAHDERLDTHVAIKEYYPRHIAGRTDGTLEVRPHTRQDTEEFERGREQFQQEGRTIARFDHPNIVDVRSYFERNGTGYLVMDYYEGQTLDAYLAASDGRLPEEEAVPLIQEVLDGLRPVHEAGVLHRDIDPQNIYRTEDGRAVLLDFGAAREAMAARSQSLSVILKEGYAPFEQYTPDGNQGPHTDIYAVAATLYKCVTGLTPPPAPERMKEDTLLPPRDVNDDLSLDTHAALLKGLARDPESRPASVEEFSRRLGRTHSVDGPEATRTVDAPTVEPASSTAPASPSASALDAEDDSSDPSVWSLAGLAALIAGLVGGTLVVSETRAVEVLAFFGTWVAVCFGLVGLFREGEKVMSGEGRAAVCDWLLREDFVRRSSNWPSTFVDLFDAVFTKHHLSWACFWRSALTSALVVTLLLAGFLGFGLLDGFVPDSTTDASAFALLSMPVLLNVGIDYLSLAETRWVLGRMTRTDRSLAHVGYLALDLVLTLLCIFVPVALVQLTVTMPAAPVWSGDFWVETLQTLGVVAEWLLRFNEDDARFLSVMMFSTLFTSVWVWLYVGAGLVLRTLHPMLKSLDWLTQYLNVEARPLHAMGLLLAVVTSVAFAVSAPLVL
jgi:serine/threonine protein kinase